MAIPLRKGNKGPLRLAGELSWPGPAVLTIRDQDIELAGKLRFTERDLQAQSIEAKLRGVSIRLRVDTRRSGKDAAATTHIQVTGRFPTAVLARRFPSQAWKLLESQARLALELTFADANLGKSMLPLDFELTSDLSDLTVTLPNPLGKPAVGTR